MAFTTPTLGAAYHAVRTRRGLAIKQVRGQLDASAVSHFERDNTDIRMTNLMALLQPTGMSMAEFAQLIQTPTPSVEAIMQKISHAYDNLDWTTLKQLLATYSDATSEDSVRYLIRLILASCVAELKNEQTQLSPTDDSFVENYLMQDGSWYGLEYIAFCNLAYSLSPETNNRVLKRMLSEYQGFHLPEYSRYFTAALYNLAVNRIEAHDFDGTRQMLRAISAVSDTNRDFLYLNHHLAFLRLLLPQLEHPTLATTAALNQFLNVTSLIDATLAAKFRGWFKQLTVQD